MAKELFQVARLKYQNIVPEECFRASVPDWLCYAPDNIVAPSHSLSSEGGIKYIKASNYEQFILACEAFHNENAASQDIVLWVIVMPYTPLEDAFRLHQLILKPDILPETFSEQLEHLEVKQGKRTEAEAVNPGQVQLLKEESGHEEDQEEDYDDEDDNWELRRGSVKLPQDQDVSVEFLVINYSTLWAKAEKYCLLQFISYPMDDILSYLTNCDKLLYQPLPETLNVLQHQLDLAKRQLIFAMHHSGRDVHDCILSMYPSIHHQVYGICARCNTAIDPVDDEETIQKLGTALNDLGIGQYNVDLSLEDAQIKLMSKQGQLEAQIIQVTEMLRFTEAKHSFQQELRAILQGINNILEEATLMGVSEMNLNDMA